MRNQQTIARAGQTDAGSAGEQPARDNRLRATDSRGDGGPKPVIPSSFKILLFRALKCLKKLPAEGRFSHLTGKAFCPIPAEPIQMDSVDSGSCKLYYYRARSYNPQAGRFLQRDLLRYVNGTNLYQYVVSSPIEYLDPLGLFGWQCKNECDPGDIQIGYRGYPLHYTIVPHGADENLYEIIDQLINHADSISYN